MATIGASLRSTARRIPDREALVFGETRYSYAELDHQVDRVAAALAEQGIAKGDRVALMSGNSDRFVIAFYAAHRLGAIFVPINPGSAAPELDYLIRDSGAAALIYSPEVEAAVLKAVGNGLPETLRILSMRESEHFPDLFAAAQPFPGEPIEVEIDEFDDAQILYTSGTTGSPKGALFDHHRQLWVGVSVMATAGLRDGDRILHVAPLYHAAELCMLIIPGTLVGATHIVQAGFDPVAVLDALERERITLFFGVPTMYQFMLRTPDLDKRELSAWRTGLFGAAPMPATAVAQLVAALPDVEFVQACGQTEAGPNGIYATHAQVRERPDASGRQALPMMQCRIVDIDGNDVAPGEVGELLLRGESIMKGYWNKPEATAETIVDGWLHTGDLTRLDPDGYMTLVDRLKDMIITGGRNVYSVEVENAIAAHPHILDCAVIARTHPEFGESIVAVAVLKEGATLTLDTLRKFCGEHIAHYKVPHDLVITDQIPRNPSGKILKRTLRERFSVVNS